MSSLSLKNLKEGVRIRKERPSVVHDNHKPEATQLCLFGTVGASTLESFPWRRHTVKTAESSERNCSDSLFGDYSDSDLSELV